jgi:hypothetical protein
MPWTSKKELWLVLELMVLKVEMLKRMRSDERSL